jgi:predicted porin
MKKSLLALAALTAFAGVASAQSSVTLSGNIKGGFASTKYTKATDGTAGGSGTSLADGSSRFILSGSESLGGGLTAIFQIDTRFRVDDNGSAPTSSPLAGGNTFVGLRGGFGTIQLGKLDTHYCTGIDTHGSRATALQASSCGILGFAAGGGTAIANASRSVNVVRYSAPPMGGLSAVLSYSTSYQGSEGSLTGSAGKGDAISLQVGYAAGPVTLMGSYWNAENEPKLTVQKAGTLAAGFNFGFGTVGVTYDKSATLGSSRQAVSIPLTFTMGSGTFLATVTKAGKTKIASGDVAGTDANLISIGYDYALSRRTSLGVSYARLNNGAAASYNLYTQAALNGTPGVLAGQDAQQLYFGIRHAY